MNKQKDKIVKNSKIKDLAIIIISSVIISIAVHKFVIFKAVIPSESMVPTLNVHDQLFVTRVYDMKKLEHGDILVFYSEEEDAMVVKRLIGLPGDSVIIKDGAVNVNGEELKEDYLGQKDKFSGEYKVPNGEYFFLGDNRKRSKDSRMWDYPYVNAKNIKGKARVKVYPFSEFGDEI